ncbi:hypothetical protein BRD09_08835 [Halobacteriales archaeon SW_10_68_16]|nr:MAG: hypothetical protein BRD09_08835 [Halobacteriales archaeon SW_10_68_16]
MAHRVDVPEPDVQLDLVSELGTSSAPFEHEITADGELAATAEALMVAYDGEAGQPRPIPEEWRERIRAHEGQ